ncbi:UNVERIFIED_CONTAM: Oligopeptide transporter 4, partial [Sesamum calycinum]
GGHHRRGDDQHWHRMVSTDDHQQHMPGRVTSSQQSVDVPERPCVLRRVRDLGFSRTQANLRRPRELQCTQLVLSRGCCGARFRVASAQGVPQQEVDKADKFACASWATAAMPPATTLNFNSWVLVGTIFNLFVFRYRKRWWQRYNYVLSAALDAGLAFMGVALYFCLGVDNVSISWWGSNGEYCDLASCPTAKGVAVDGCPVH